MTVMFPIAILSDAFITPWRASALATRRRDGNTPSIPPEEVLETAASVFGTNPYQGAP